MMRQNDTLHLQKKRGFRGRKNLFDEFCVGIWLLLLSYVLILPSWKLINILFLDGTIGWMISSFFPFGGICDHFLEGNNHATWENLIQTGFCQLKKESKKELGTQNSNGELFHRAHVVCSLPLPTPTKRNKTSKTNPVLKKKTLRKLPQNLPSAIFVCTPWKISRWNPKSWSFVSDDFFQCSVNFSFKILIFRGVCVIMMIP